MVMLGSGVVLPHLPHHPGLPCPLRSVTGVPCPLCGMTTAVEQGLSGHVRASLVANPFGLVAIVVALVLVVRPRTGRLAVGWPVLVPAVVAAWLWELRRYGLA